MSDTIRIYNINDCLGVYHKYKQLCMGNCKNCRDPMISKRRRLYYKNNLIVEVNNL